MLRFAARPGAAAAAAARRPWPWRGGTPVSTATWRPSTASSGTAWTGAAGAGRPARCQPWQRPAREAAGDPLGGHPDAGQAGPAARGPWRPCATQELPAGPAWEIVVVDDGSSDGTAAFLAGRSRPAPGPRLRVVTPAGGTWGGPRARNLGRARGPGRWLLFLDDDIVAPPGLLAAHLELLEADPRRRHHRLRGDRARPRRRAAFPLPRHARRGASLPAGAGAGALSSSPRTRPCPARRSWRSAGSTRASPAYGFEDMEVAFRLEDRAGCGSRSCRHPVPVHVHHHTLAEYLAKKARVRPPVAAACWPGGIPARLREMRLHHGRWTCPADRPPAGLRGCCGRCLDGPLGRALPAAAGGAGPPAAAIGRWPAALYARLHEPGGPGGFRQGLRACGRHDCQNGTIDCHTGMSAMPAGRPPELACRSPPSA